MEQGKARIAAKTRNRNGRRGVKKALQPKPQGLVFPGRAERDRTVGLLNAIRNTAPMEPEIPRKDGYPDPESGD